MVAVCKRNVELQSLVQSVFSLQVKLTQETIALREMMEKTAYLRLNLTQEATILHQIKDALLLRKLVQDR